MERSRNNHGKRGMPIMTYQYTCENSAEFIFSTCIVFMRMRGLEDDRTDLLGSRGGYKYARVKITPKFYSFLGYCLGE